MKWQMLQGKIVQIVDDEEPPTSPYGTRNGSRHGNSGNHEESFQDLCGPADVGNMYMRPDTSISVILKFCHRRVLKNYNRLLAAVGWKPLVDWFNFTSRILNCAYLALVICLLFFGHILQYYSCFRRDGHYGDPPVAFNDSSISAAVSKCPNAIGIYLIPACLQLAAYAMMMLQMRSPESENIQSLAENVFLQCTVAWDHERARIARRLSGVYAAGTIWLLASVVCQMVDIFSTSRVSFGVEGWSHWTLVGLLVACTVVQDFVSMTIAIAYGIHCQLALVYLQNLNQSLRERKVNPLKYYKGCSQVIDFVRYINGKQATAITLQTIWLVCRLLASAEAFLETRCFVESSFAAVNVVLWLTLLCIPLIQASRLTSTCSHVSELGLELHGRPFGFQDLPIVEMNSLLLFTSNFKISAKLCSIIISKQRICILFLMLATAIVVSMQRGDLHLLS